LPTISQNDLNREGEIQQPGDQRIVDQSACVFLPIACSQEEMASINVLAASIRFPMWNLTKADVSNSSGADG
jgi:hypothetical protein